MSTAIQGVNQAAAVERVTEIARRVLDTPEYTQALAVADSVKAGLMVADDAQAGAIVDQVKILKAGMKAVKDWQARVLQLPSAMEKAVRSITTPTHQQLADAYAVLANATTEYNLRRQREAQAVARAKADAEAEALKAKGVVADPDAPAEVLPKEPARTIHRGGTGSSSLVMRKRVELVDAAAYAAVNPGGLELSTEAKKQEEARWAECAARGVAHPAGGFVLNGVRYYEQPGSQFR